MPSMDRLNKTQPAYQPRPDTAAAIVAAAERLVLATVPAAWPAGVSQLAQAIDACQRGQPGQGGLDWSVRASL